MSVPATHLVWPPTVLVGPLQPEVSTEPPAPSPGSRPRSRSLSQDACPQGRGLWAQWASSACRELTPRGCKPNPGLRGRVSDGLGQCWGRDRSWEGREGLETLGLLCQGLAPQPWAPLVLLQPQPRANLFSASPSPPGQSGERQAPDPQEP